MKRLIYLLTTYKNLYVNRKNPHRFLEIGSGTLPLIGFETLNIQNGKNVDYVWDASKKLPFKDDAFELIYASHILEHIPWYQIDDVIKEWVRVLKIGGNIEVWVPNGLKICKLLIDYEIEEKNYIHKDGWYRYNSEKSPYKWVAGRIFTYGDGTGRTDHPNWHRALFTPKYLKLLFINAGLKHVRELGQSDVRGYDHGWINLGMVGTK